MLEFPVPVLYCNSVSELLGISSSSLSTPPLLHETRKKIRNNNYAVSVIECKGKKAEEKRYMLFIEINKRRLKHLRSIIDSEDKDSFIVINESKVVERGYIK